MADPDVQRVRVYDVVRSAHLERLAHQAPGVLLGRSRRYDFDPTLTSGVHLEEGGTAWTVRRLWALAPEVIEVNEPLMRSGIARTAAAVAATALRARLAGRRARVVTYAIENIDPLRTHLPGAGPATRLQRVGERVLSRLLARRVDRIAFGTEASAVLYDEVLGHQLDGAERRVVPALSAPCGCAPALRDADRVLFLGALSPRKGADRLLAAWPGVVDARPTAALTVVGSGALEGAARSVAGARPEVELVVDPPREQVHAELRRASVLVLLSQPAPSWREQVGLPLVEALAHGCTVVTTEQTGLAEWLGAHGHHVLPVASGPDEIAAAVVRALDSARTAADVQADLPVRDGRLAADDWLHR